MWAPKGSRPRAIRQQQFEYLFEVFYIGFVPQGLTLGV
jgi:hypothetical protein